MRLRYEEIQRCRLTEVDHMIAHSPNKTSDCVYFFAATAHSMWSSPRCLFTIRSDLAAQRLQWPVFRCASGHDHSGHA